ncbi:MAG: GGDEF domain-containing protein [Acidobacteriota bacterium]|nr:GGDEF domain-containing protein [Acidobacteriota bacterium]
MLRRRHTDRTLKAVDGLLDASVQKNDLGGRRLANLAAAIAIENSGAQWGCLLLADDTGLVPSLCLRGDLEPDRRGLDKRLPQLVRQAEESQKTTAENDEVAAPILSQGRVSGMLYLIGVPRHRRTDATRLAESVASRIAALLANAELVDRLARSTRDLEILESLSLSFSAETLRTAHLDQALERAVQATGSDEGLLGVVGQSGELLDTRVIGEDSERLSSTAQALSAANFDSKVTRQLLGPVFLLEPLVSDTFTPVRDDERVGRIGFLAVRRHGDALYGDTDRSFFRALAHIVAGALARHDYFQKAARDPLTNTGSRLALSLSLAEAENRTRSSGAHFSVVLLDVDNFKEINDEYGHAVGDDVLRTIGSLLRDRLRARDSVARYGGDEFVIVLADTPVEEAERLAEALRNLVRGADFPGIERDVSISAGVAACTPALPDIDHLMRRADRALYRSKAAGRDRVSVATPNPAED